MPTRRYGRSWHLALLASLLAICSAITPAKADKSYRITGVNIDAALSPDGSMAVTESRTYDFRGSFRYAYRTIPLDSERQYSAIRLREGGLEYRLADTEEPGTYRVRERGDELEVRWFFRARNESRTFDLHFRVHPLVERHVDAALLYFQFIGRDWDRASSNVQMRVAPPEPLTRDAVRAWLHGPLWAKISIGAQGELLAHCAQLPRRTHLEIRALYPPQSFPHAPQRSTAVRAAVMEEEARAAEEANREREAAVARLAAQREREAVGQKVIPALSALGVIGLILFFRRYGRRPEVNVPAGLTAALPSQTPPALVGYLLHDRQVTARDLVATLLDLAGRGFLDLREEEREEGRLFGGTKQVRHHIWRLDRDRFTREGDELLAYERALVSFLFDELVAGADELDMKTVAKKKSKVQSFFRKWSREVKEEGKQRAYYDAESLRGMTRSILLGVVMAVLGLLGVLLFGVWSFILVAAGVVVLVLSLLIAHRTPEGEVEARGWRSLKRYLKQADAVTQHRAHLLGEIHSYLVYGIVLGLGAKVYQRLVEIIPQDGAARYVPWYAWHSGSGDGFSAAAFSSAFSSMVATATSTMSSASGTGGGASGGGGGGAGGGGGGAG